MNKWLKVCLSLALVLSFIVFKPSSKSFANASDSSPSVELLEDNKVVEENGDIEEDIYLIDNTEELSIPTNNIEPNAIVGGGVVKCKGLSKKAECDLTLAALEPISIAVFNIKIYKIDKNGNKSNVKTFERKKYPSGKTVIYDNFLIKNLSAGNYQISVGGYMYGYSDIPLSVKTFWSGKFTVKK